MLAGFGIGLALLSVVALFSMPMAYSDSDVECIGLLASGEHKKVVVPKNKTCTIFGDTVVLKNVKVNEGATLNVFGGTIEGNIDLKKDSNLYMFDGTVGKSIKGKQTDIVIIAEASKVGKVSITKATGETAIVDSVVEKNVKITKQQDGFVYIQNNEIGGNLHVHKGDTVISSHIKSNTIGGNLDCKNNSTPLHSDGGINIVSGLKKHQCAAELGF